jgi:regulator of RNase E activity RraA
VNLRRRREGAAERRLDDRAHLAAARARLSQHVRQRLRSSLSHLRLLGYTFPLLYAPARKDLDVDVDFDNETNVQRLAVEAIAPEEVLVIDARGELRAASFGHILTRRIKIRARRAW